jgi:hypothetical protein
MNDVTCRSCSDVHLGVVQINFTYYLSLYTVAAVRMPLFVVNVL